MAAGSAKQLLHYVIEGCFYTTFRLIDSYCFAVMSSGMANWASDFTLQKSEHDGSQFLESTLNQGMGTRRSRELLIGPSDVLGMASTGALKMHERFERGGLSWEAAQKEKRAAWLDASRSNPAWDLEGPACGRRSARLSSAPCEIHSCYLLLLPGHGHAPQLNQHALRHLTRPLR